MPNEPEKKLRIGTIGLGGFGHFALQHFLQVPGVEITGMSGTHRPASQAAAKRFGVPDIVEPEQMVQMDEVDLVYIATPPFLHYDQAKLALNAGKHVICEKPLATTVAEGKELIELAESKGLLMIANLMQRYNPMLYKVQNIIKERILGELLYGRFENLASDEGLAPDHWFWDPKMSGGIFIEHGVHFFDLFEAWFGKGEVNSAQAGYRQPDGQLEHVNCAVKYAGEKFVNFYHGFHQSGRMDRQEFRLVFERGEIVLEEWVPTRMKLEALTEETQTRRLMDLFPKARLDILVNYGSNRETKGRFKEIDAYQKVRITDGLQTDKMVLYGELLRSMIADQKAWVEDKSHERKLTERNGLKSLQDAERASDLASVTRS